VITSQLKQYDVFKENLSADMGKYLQVSRLLHFDHKGSEMIAIGQYNGQVIIKQAETLLSDDTITTLKSANDMKDSDSEQELALNRQRTNLSQDSMDKEDKVTYLGFFTQPNRIIFGSKEGFITIWNVTKGLNEKTKDDAIIAFKMPQNKMKKVIQIIELPSKVANAKKHVYYILTIGNLYVMNKNNPAHIL